MYSVFGVFVHVFSRKKNHRFIVRIVFFILVSLKTTTVTMTTNDGITRVLYVRVNSYRVVASSSGARYEKLTITVAAAAAVRLYTCGGER